MVPAVRLQGAYVLSNAYHHFSDSVNENDAAFVDRTRLPSVIRAYFVSKSW